jgi:hypothetical protein
MTPRCRMECTIVQRTCNGRDDVRVRQDSHCRLSKAVGAHTASPGIWEIRSNRSTVLVTLSTSRPRSNRPEQLGLHFSALEIVAASGRGGQFSNTTNNHTRFCHPRRSKLLRVRRCCNEDENIQLQNLIALSAMANQRYRPEYQCTRACRQEVQSKLPVSVFAPHPRAS